MSRSYKKEPYYSCNAGSFKIWKREINSTLRTRSKIKINTCEDWDELVMPVINECGNYWTSPKDGLSRRQERPAINQCDLDLQKYARLGLISESWYTVNVEGHLKYCDCYGNKCSDYWKMLRK